VVQPEPSGAVQDGTGGLTDVCPQLVPLLLEPVRVSAGGGLCDVSEPVGVRRGPLRGLHRTLSFGVNRDERGVVVRLRRE
jgi:hypothetical protein